MKDWLTNHMILLLTEDGKLAEILGALTFFQCVAFLFIFMLMMKLSDKADKKVR